MTGQGDQGDTGERGDHGERGVAGERGEKGDHGQQGEAGPPYSSWLTRHVVAAYLLVVVGVVLSFALSLWLNDGQITRINERGVQNCETGNERSRLQIEVLTDSQRRFEALDLTLLLGTPPDQVPELRRLSRENYERRVASWPFLDCRTGQRVTQGETTTTTTSPPNG